MNGEGEREKRVKIKRVTEKEGESTDEEERELKEALVTGGKEERGKKRKSERARRRGR